MLCNVCRDDLPEPRFHGGEYLNARVKGCHAVCIQCKPLTKKQRRKRTLDSVAALGGRNKEQVTSWNKMSLDQKKKKQMNIRTPSEKKLEKALCGAGIIFKVQHSVGCYWADFYIPESSLVVEVDGEIHNTQAQQQYDHRRNEWMQRHGYKVLRFTNQEVDNEIDRIVSKIKQFVQNWAGVDKKKIRPLSGSVNMAPVYVPPNRVNSNVVQPRGETR